MRGVEGLSSHTLTGKDGSSHRFQKPSGPQRPSAWRLRIRIKRRITSPWGLLLFVSFSTSSSLSLSSLAPLLSLSLFHYPTRGHLALHALGHADKAFRKGGTRGAKLQRNEFRLHIRRIAFLRPVSCPRAKCPPSSLAARTFSSLRFATLRRFFSLSPFCPTIGRQIPRRREGQSWPPVYHSIYQS